MGFGVKIKMTKREDCPFCGENDTTVQLGLELEPGMYAAAVMCRTCDGQGAISGDYDTEEEAIEDAILKWNSRVDDWIDASIAPPSKSGEYWCYLGGKQAGKQGVREFDADVSKKFDDEDVTHWKHLAKQPR